MKRVIALVLIAQALAAAEPDGGSRSEACAPGDTSCTAGNTMLQMTGKLGAKVDTIEAVLNDAIDNADRLDPLSAEESDALEPPREFNTSLAQLDHISKELTVSSRSLLSGRTGGFWRSIGGLWKDISGVVKDIYKLGPNDWVDHIASAVIDVIPDELKEIAEDIGKHVVQLATAAAPIVAKAIQEAAKVAKAVALKAYDIGTKMAKAIAEAAMYLWNCFTEIDITKLLCDMTIGKNCDCDAGSSIDIGFTDFSFGGTCVLKTGADFSKGMQIEFGGHGQQTKKTPTDNTKSATPTETAAMKDKMYSVTMASNKNQNFKHEGKCEGNLATAIVGELDFAPIIAFTAKNPANPTIEVEVRGEMLGSIAALIDAEGLCTHTAEAAFPMAGKALNICVLYNCFTIWIEAVVRLDIKGRITGAAELVIGASLGVSSKVSIEVAKGKFEADGHAEDLTFNVAQKVAGSFDGSIVLSIGPRVSVLPIPGVPVSFVTFFSAEAKLKGTVSLDSSLGGSLVQKKSKDSSSSNKSSTCMGAAINVFPSMSTFALTLPWSIPALDAGIIVDALAAAIMQIPELLVFGNPVGATANCISGGAIGGLMSTAADAAAGAVSDTLSGIFPEFDLSGDGLNIFTFTPFCETAWKHSTCDSHELSCDAQTNEERAEQVVLPVDQQSEHWTCYASLYMHDQSIDEAYVSEGWVSAFPPGNYPRALMEEAGSGNDQISYIRLHTDGRDCRLKAYWNDNFEANYYPIDSNGQQQNRALGGTNWNDQISSLKIWEQSATCNDNSNLWAIPTSACPSNPSALKKCDSTGSGDMFAFCKGDTSSCEATVYNDKYMRDGSDSQRRRRGWSAKLTEGTYTKLQFEAKGGKSDQASAVKVQGAGCYAILYGDDNFKGWTATFHTGSYTDNFDVRRRHKNAHNDQMTSMKVLKQNGNCNENVHLKNCGGVGVFWKGTSDKHHLIRIPSSACPTGEFVPTKNCGEASPGELCLATGQPGTSSTNNCGSKSIYQKAHLPLQVYDPEATPSGSMPSDAVPTLPSGSSSLDESLAGKS